MVAENTLTKEDFRLKGQVGRQGIATLIRLQELISRQGSYAYLEIGSYLGKSLQPHIQDADCRHALSIDLRPELTPDERGALTMYEHIRTEDMLDGLRQYASEAQLAKLQTSDTTSDVLQTREGGETFDLALIDGEHTIEAAFRDFMNALLVMNENCIIAFDDTHIVYPAIQNARSYLESRGIPYEVRFGGGYITGVFIGPEGSALAAAFSDTLCLGEEKVKKAYEDNMATSHVERFMSRQLRRDIRTRRKAIQTLRNLGCSITEPQDS